MKNYAEGIDMPLGLGMALAQNLTAMKKFSALSPEQQQQMIAHVHEINSRKEMRGFVQHFAEGTITF